MKINDQSAWIDFVYKLWYPAILGSMIYDVANFRPHQLVDGYYLVRALILVFFCVDYLHLYNDVREASPPVRDLVIDLTVAVLWRVAYSFAAVENYRVAVLIVAVISLELCWYLNRTTLQRWYMGTLAAWVWACVVVSYLRDQYVDLHFHAVALAVALVAYATYVFVLFGPLIRRQGGYADS
jgi:hypothetical protein